MMPKWTEKDTTIRGRKKKADIQEKSLAKRFNGRTTIGSGNQSWDKADIHILRNRGQLDSNGVRIECKRTDKDCIKIEKKWIEKLKMETRPDEFWSMELEINDTKCYLISESEFRFLINILTASASELANMFREV